MYVSEPECRNELIRHGKIETGDLTAYFFELASSPGDSATTFVLNPLNLYLPAAPKIVLLGYKNRTIRTPPGVPAPAVKHAYGSA